MDPGKGRADPPPPLNPFHFWTLLDQKFYHGELLYGHNTVIWLLIKQMPINSSFQRIITGYMLKVMQQGPGSTLEVYNIVIFQQTSHLTTLTFSGNIEFGSAMKFLRCIFYIYNKVYWSIYKAWIICLYAFIT